MILSYILSHRIKLIVNFIVIKNYFNGLGFTYIIDFVNCYRVTGMHITSNTRATT